MRQLSDRLYPGGPSSAFTTVQKLLERLERKGMVQRDRSGPVQTFAAQVDRSALVRSRVWTVADQLCRGSLATLLTHLIDAGRLSAEKRRELRRYLKEIDRDDRPRGDGA
jgi:predicted transcriptional regulator